MRRSLLAAAAFALLAIGSISSARAASALPPAGSLRAERPLVQEIYWAIDPYGRRYWVPVYRRRFDGPPVYYHPYRHRGWRDRWGRWHY